MRALLIVATSLGCWTTAAAQQLSIIVVGDKYGYIDRAGRIAITPRFQYAEAFSEGLAYVCLGTSLRCGFTDTTGAMVIEPRFDQVVAASRFSAGRANVRVDGNKWGYVDRSGRFVITPQFQRAGVFSNGRAAVEMNGAFGYIDTTGKVVIQPRFASAWDFSEGLAAVWTSNEGGFIDTTGTMVIRPPEWRSGPGQMVFVSEVPVRFTQGRLPILKGDKWGYIDRSGKVVIQPRFDGTQSFSEGLAAVRTRDKWGYIDTTGRIVIEPQFSSVGAFSEGLAAVLIEGNIGYIDAAGRIAIPPQYFGPLYNSAFSNGLACVSLLPYRDVPDACLRLGDYIDRTGRTVWHAAPAEVTQRPAAPPPDTTPLPGTGPLVDRVAAVVDRAEAAERGQPVDRPDQIMSDVTKATTQLAAHLDSHPDDVRALILSVRLGRFHTVAQPVVTGGGRPVPTFATLAAEYAPHHASLNHALTLDPNNAEGHYWKARLFGLSHDWIGMLYGVSDVPPAEDSLARAYADSAIRYGRRAVELAPDRVPYREALAIYLILNDQENEAATVLHEVASGRHPMSILLADWAAIPLPVGAVPLRGQASGMARTWMEEGSIKDYPFLRVRMYVVRMPADSVQAFYRRHWPGFRFLLAEHQEMGAARMRSFGQYIRWQDGRVVAARDTAQIPDEPTEGVVISLIEIANPPAEVRQQFPVPLGNVFCSLSFIDLRSFDAR